MVNKFTVFGELTDQPSNKTFTRSEPQDLKNPTLKKLNPTVLAELGFNI